MALPSSGVPLSLGTLADNKSSSSRADLSLQNLSRAFASGSQVGNVDGSGAANTTADRSLLNSSPYSISEFYDAEFPNEFFDSVLVRNTADTATFSDSVDSEGIKVKWTVNTVPTPSTYTAGLKYKSDDTVAVQNTFSDSTTGTKTVAMTTPNASVGGTGNANYWYPFVKTTDFLQAVGSDLTHYNKLGTITIANPGSPSHTVAAHTTTQAITQTHTQETATYGAMTAGIAYAWTFARDGTTSTDGTANPSPTTSTSAAQSVTYTGPGVYTAALTVTANPSGRNTSAATTISHTIEYTDAVTIDSIGSVNEGSTVAVDGTAKGLQYGVKRGLVASTATTTFIATKSSDDTSDSRYVADSPETDFSVPSQTNTTGVYQGRIVALTSTGTVDNTVSANTSNFNVYPSISDEFASGDISVSVDPVIVGANTVLSVANITDSITGYAWAMTSGTGTMTSTNVTGGGSGGDTQSIIDETTAATNTVSFDAAQSSKTIQLTLQGRLLQTVSVTKTLSVELADAVTVNNPSSVNEGSTITISGTQAGFQSGVRFGMVTDGGTVYDVGANPDSRDDSTDSRYTSDAYTGTFTVPAQTDTTTSYDAYAHGIGVGTVNARSTTFKVYPLISNEYAAGDISTVVDGTSTAIVYKSTTTPGSETVASKKMTFAFANDVADNTTGYTYAMTSGTGDFHSDNASGGTQSADSGTGTSVIDLTDTGTNVTTFTAVGSKTIRIHVAGILSQRPYVEKTVTVNFLPEFQSLTITSGTSNVVPSSALTWTVVYNGFPAQAGTPVSIKTINNSTGGTIASFAFPSGTDADIPATAQNQTSQTVTSTSVSSTLTVPGTNGLTWYLQATRSGITSINSTTATNLTVYNTTVYVGDNALGTGPAAYDSIIDAADDANTAGWDRSDTVYWGSTTGDSTMGVNSALKDAATLADNWAFVSATKSGLSTPLYINQGQSTIKTLNASKVVTATVSSTPPATHTVTHTGGIGAITVTGAGGNTTVARHWRVNHATNSTFTANSTNVDVAESNHDSNEGFSSTISLSAATYYVRVALKNADKQGSWVTSTSGGQTVYDPVTIVAKLGGTSYATTNTQTSQANLSANTIYEGPVNEAELFEDNLGGTGDHMYQLFQVRGGIPGSSSVKLTLSETFNVFSDSMYRYEVNVDSQTYAWATYSGSPWKTADSTGITIDDADGINIFVALRGETSGTASDTDAMTLKCIWEQDTSVFATYQFVGTVGGLP